MTTVLLIVIYIAFLGIGIPDSLFGAAWPAIYPEFGVPLSMANFISIIVAGGTVISSFFSSRVIGFLGTAKTVAISTLMTAIGLFGFSCSKSFLPLCLCAIPLGLGAGSIDTALNNFVALHYKASHMSFLHCIGNLGTFISPYIMSFALAVSDNWRGGYRTMFGIQLTIAAITFLSLPLWKTAHSPNLSQAEKVKIRTLSAQEVWNLPNLRPTLSMFFCSCAIEFTCGLWGSTFLVESRGLALDSAAVFAAIYYLGMTLGRLFSGLLSPKLSSWHLIFLGEGILLFALVILLLPLPPTFSAVGLFLIGLGNGPVFPNLTHLTPHTFGAECSQSVMGIQLSVANTGILLTPALFGFLAQRLSTGLFPRYILALYSVLLIGTLVMKKD